MTNEEIIKSIKSEQAEGVIELASKYGISIEAASRIAETVKKRDVQGILKQRVADCFYIIVRWNGCGYLGSFTTRTRFLFDKNKVLVAAYGE